jgi:hypothetical protein
VSWEAIGTIADIVGATAVIITLVYLAYQIRLNNKYLLQESQRARSQAARENLAYFAQNAEIWIKDRDGETLTEVEAFRLEMMWLRLLWGYQTSFQHLPRAQLAAQAGLIRRWFHEMPSFRATWKQNCDSYQPDFIGFMCENIVRES